VTVLLRTADDVDLTAVGALHRASRTAAYAGLVPAAGLAAGSAEAMGEWWTERVRWERDTHRLTVAEVSGRPGLAGFSYVGPSETAGAVELYAIHVDPTLVGTGVGRALMLRAVADLAAVAAEQGDIGRAVLWVLAGNSRARRFYERGGWTADGETRDAPIGPELVPQVRYARPVGSV
jgi:GNAT superfamily N-acetyltransferase